MPMEARFRYQTVLPYADGVWERIEGADSAMVTNSEAPPKVLEGPGHHSAMSKETELVLSWFGERGEGLLATHGEYMHDDPGAQVLRLSLPAVVARYDEPPPPPPDETVSL